MGNSLEVDGDGELEKVYDSVLQDESYWDLFEKGFDMAVRSMLRPPRQQYRIDQLGPRHFYFGGRRFYRECIVLENDKGHSLRCYHWRPMLVDAGVAVPCVVYMHSQKGSLLESLDILRVW